jgi:cation transport regulator ChaC
MSSQLNLKEVILDNIQYKPAYDKKEGERTISASMIGSEPLINYLKMTEGSVEKQSIGDNTLGSVFHLGMEHFDFKEDKLAV